MKPTTRSETAAILGNDTLTQKPVKAAFATRPQHLCVIGKTGYGKTTLLEHLILTDLTNYTSAILIDPHGDLSQRLITLATGRRTRADYTS